MKIIVLFSLLISSLSFAQDKNDLRSLPKSSQTITKIKEPTFMVNDSLVDKKLAVKLNLDLIKSIVIVKDNPEYPDGLIKISYEKK